MNTPAVLDPGTEVYSKRCGRIGGFDGIIVERRGNGYRVLNPKTKNTYQREPRDLIVTERASEEVSA